MGSLETLYTNEALAENKAMVSKAKFWVLDDGLTIDIDSPLVNRVIHNLLADPI